MNAPQSLGRIVGGIVDVDNADPGEIGSDADTERAFDEMDEATDTGAEKGTLYILRINQDERGRALDKGKSEHCFSCSIDEYSYLELVGRILREYGPGMYRLYAKRQGQRGAVFNRIVRLAAKLEEKAAQGQSQLSELAQIMAQSSQRTEALIMRMMENRQTAQAVPVDPMDGMLKMAQMMTMLMTAMRPMGAPQPNSSMLETIQTIKELDKLRGSFSGNGGGDDDNSTVGILKALAPAAGSFFQLLATQKQQGLLSPQMPQMPSIPNPPPLHVPGMTAPPQNQPTADPQGQEQKVLAFFRDKLRDLASVAGEKPDVKAIVSMMMPQVPEEFDDKLQDILEEDNWFANLSALQPAIVPHREWFTALRDEILRCYEDAPDAGAVNSK